ncbi:MAG: bifunctional metallophosphatase/5'-nucleotidase [Deltaproteobacteria bacterium]|nr:bifunctional metallophosphatase/5'-nucleotidase [Deltaproteobacteria bacterium]
MPGGRNAEPVGPGRRSARLAGLVLVLLSALAAWATPALAAPARLTFFLLNDHYVLEPVDGGMRGGMARVATLLRQQRAARPDSLFILAGDTISPSLVSSFLQGAQMIGGYNAVGLDIATFGNHEFDFGPEVLQQRMRESRFAWVSSNVRDAATGQPFGGARPWLLRTLSGVRVGIFGLTTPETASSSKPGPGVQFLDPVSAAREAVAALRARGATVLVGVTHLPVTDDLMVAESLPVDLILGGHEHEPLVAAAGETLILKAGSDARWLGQVDLAVGPDGRVRERRWRLHPVTLALREDAGVRRLVASYNRRVSKELDVVVAQTTVPLDARGATLRTRESNVGDLIADIMREAVGAEVAIMNGGGIRTDRVLPPGPVTRRDVLDLLPFLNLIVKAEMDGATLLRALEHGVAEVEHAAGRFPQVSGLRFSLDPSRPPGGRILGVEVGGHLLDPQRRYTVALNDFMYRGGDRYAMFAGARLLLQPESAPSLTDAMIAALQSRKTIGPTVEGRISRIE